MAEKSIGNEMLDKLSYKKQNVYESASPETVKKIFDYADGYVRFLDNAKTEREAVKTAVRLAEDAGFRSYTLGDKISVGDNLYCNNRGKSVVFIHVGDEDIENEGVRIIASHIDSPRLDIKPIPLYEDSNMCFLKTHYYGGIKKYQWTATPLALHGVIVKADGEIVDVKIGDEPGDPVFYVNDLLPHLSQKQYGETLGNAIPGETLNVLIGGMPYADDEVSEKVKLNTLSLLFEKYGICEEDFMSAELTMVPAFNARDIGFDRALIGAYGHDDKVCSYPALTALLENKNTNKTVIVVFADKEETGSDGVTGMQSDILTDIIAEISAALGKNERVVRAHSKCLSADVTAAYDPNFADVYEKRNSSIISCGAAIAKYTGARGKSSTNDASAELLGYVRKLFRDNGVIFQVSEMGKVDAGGGGTVAKYISLHNIDTIDIGVPVISMHAPFEVVSKADIYSTFEALSVFLK